MDRIEDILAALSRRDPGLKITDAVKLCAKQNHFPALIRILLESDQERARAFSAWILGRAAQKEYWSPGEKESIALLDMLMEENQEMVQRAVIDIFQYADIPESCMSQLSDLCIRYIRNPKEAIAVRAFSITVFMRIVSQYPDLFNEVEDVLHSLRENGSAALRVRSRRALEQMEGIS